MTPQGQGVAPPQTWWSKNWKWVVALGVVVPTMCCGTSLVVALVAGVSLTQAIEENPAVFAPDDTVRVDCGTPGPGGVDCTLKRTAGSSKVEVCWDLEITCANQGVMTGHACSTLAGTAKGGTANMAVDGFSNQEGCDAPKSGAVVNLVVTPEL